MRKVFGSIIWTVSYKVKFVQSYFGRLKENEINPNKNFAMACELVNCFGR